MGRLDEEQTGPAIPIMLVTVAMVLVLACANVANLLLARGVSRQRELAVRAAIGASRMRIGRQLLVEGMLLALAGGSGGHLLAMLVLSGLRASLPEILLTTQPYIEEIGIDGTTFGYTLIDFTLDQRGIRTSPGMARDARAASGRPQGIGLNRRKPRHAAASHRSGCRGGRPVDAAVDRRRPAGPQLQRSSARRPGL